MLPQVGVPNQTEASELGGSQDLDESTRQIQKLGVKNVVVTLGGSGYGILRAGSARVEKFPLAQDVKDWYWFEKNKYSFLFSVFYGFYNNDYIWKRFCLN